MAAVIKGIERRSRSEGMASVLAIGTANPPNAVDQSTFPDYYFRVTNGEHLTHLKAKFKRICEAVKVKNRYMYLTEELLKEHHNLCTWMEPSLNTRRELEVERVPRLAMEAATRAIKEWGRSKSEITHLVFCTTLGFDLPGADLRRVKLLGLPYTVMRAMMYMQGCFAGAMSLRIAKAIAENDRDARVLVVCAETNMGWFRGPNESHPDNLVGQAVLSDGAGGAGGRGRSRPRGGEAPLRDSFDVAEGNPQQRERGGRAAVGRRTHLLPGEGSTQHLLQQHSWVPRGGLSATGDVRLELHFLDGTPRWSGLSRQVRGEAGPRPQEVVGVEARPQPLR